MLSQATVPRAFLLDLGAWVNMGGGRWTGDGGRWTVDGVLRVWDFGGMNEF
ncbi:MAG: hypothetical protein WCR52_24395 [Bacteroidota bacterium]